APAAGAPCDAVPREPVVKQFGTSVVLSWGGDGMRELLALTPRVVARVASPVLFHGATASDGRNDFYLNSDNLDVLAELRAAVTGFSPRSGSAGRSRRTRRFNLEVHDHRDPLDGITGIS